MPVPTTVVNGDCARERDVHGVWRRGRRCSGARSTYVAGAVLGGGCRRTGRSTGSPARSPAARGELRL